MKGRCSLGLKSTSLSPSVTLLKTKNKGRPFMVTKKRQGQAAFPAEGVGGTLRGACQGHGLDFSA